MDADRELDDGDYRTLADFRHALRRFLAFSEDRAHELGLTPQQHQALLVIRGAPSRSATVGQVAARLLLKPNSASGLVYRLEVLDLVARVGAPGDRRRSMLVLTPKAETMLAALSAAHRDELRRLRRLMTDLLARLD